MPGFQSGQTANSSSSFFSNTFQLVKSAAEQAWDKKGDKGTEKINRREDDQWPIGPKTEDGKSVQDTSDIVTENKLDEWSEILGWEVLINKRGTTWKLLPSELQNSITTKEAAFRLMQDKHSVIKRPVIEAGFGSVLLGFNEEQLGQLLVKIKRKLNE
jgi:arsenate reductase-like glutaredoxin family protein